MFRYRLGGRLMIRQGQSDFLRFVSIVRSSQVLMSQVQNEAVGVWSMGNDALFLNKIAGAILSAGLLAMLTGFASHMLYSPKQLDTPAYMIAVDEPTTTVAKAARRLDRSPSPPYWPLRPDAGKSREEVHGVPHLHERRLE